jgi:AhpC/TSA family protein
MGLQQQLDALKARFEANAPADALTIMHQVTEDLRRTGLAERALKVGDRAPDFALPNQNGESVRSQDLLARGPLVVSFYRGVW